MKSGGLKLQASMSIRCPLARIGSAPTGGRPPSTSPAFLSRKPCATMYDSARKITLSTWAYIPWGSCTMKHNPRLNEAIARLPGFIDIHPLQPQSTVQGALELMDQLATWLLKITGMAAVALSPKAGAHGELCGMMAIKSALAARGETRTYVLVPESAHGTNPATAALLGYKVLDVPAREDGTVDAAEVQDLIAAHPDDIAAIMLTNPNTCGLFEPDIVAIADAVHAAGGYFYCDGANLNAILGKARPGDLGVDAMHINLHKTFSTPHGGGGPGAGPVVLSPALARHAPLPFVTGQEGRYRLVETPEDAGDTEPFGRMTAFHGQMGMFTRALSWMLSHGHDGMRQASRRCRAQRELYPHRIVGSDDIALQPISIHA